MAGGQATNAGIDYQQRVAAWCLISLFTDFDISTCFGQLDESLKIEKVLFETERSIDDLNLECSNKTRIFLQVKRSISLSTQVNSDFVKTIVQFTKEFIKDQFTSNYFGLITTSDASKKITYDLKKISLSLRLNENAFVDNPLNKSEKDTLEKLEIVFATVYQQLVGKKSDKATFIKFVKRIFVAVFDIETGHTNETACLYLLRGVGFKRPELVWAVLIKNCLYYASERLSVEKEKLKEIFDKYLKEEINSQSVNDSIENFLSPKFILQGEFSVGKEILLIESFVKEECDYMIVELFRFADDCKIKNIFYDNKIRIRSGDEWVVMQRFATHTGLDRFIDENHEIFSDKKIVILPAKDIESAEETECAKMHKAYLKELYEQNKHRHLCLHCGKGVNATDALIVEIEDKDAATALGIVHRICVRPIDRILGTVNPTNSEEKEYLKTFDFYLWVSLLMKGQGQLNFLRSYPQILYGRTPIIAWKSDVEYDTEYSYCIKFILEDGSTSYSYNRGRIERLNLLQAEYQKKVYNERFDQVREDNDPFCCTSKTKYCGSYSEVSRIKEPDEEILEIKFAEIAKYSKLIAKAFDNDISFYAPCCLVLDKKTELIINLNNVVPLISDPLKMDNLLQNWEQLDFILDNSFELKIIKSDQDFDNAIRSILADGFIPILDPLFDKNFNLIQGYPIQEFNKIVAEKERSDKNKPTISDKPISEQR